MRDLRKYARQTNARILLGGLLLLFTVGLGLIYVFYGPRGALTGLLCLLTAFVPIGLVVLALWLLEKLVRRSREDDL